MTFKKEIEWFNQNQKVFQFLFPDTVLVIHNQEVIGVFTDSFAALKFRNAKFTPKLEVLIREVNHVEGINIININ